MARRLEGLLLVRKSPSINANGTADGKYTERLQALEKKRWKTFLDVQRPYRWNLRSLGPGKTMEIGCGIGRCLKGLPAGSIGIDHNEHSIRVIREIGLEGFSPEEFRLSSFCRTDGFDTLLLSHVLEHMDQEAGIALIREYLPYLRKGGQVILICPQEKGFSSDETHVIFLDIAALRGILESLGLVVEKAYSFPFPRFIGKAFVYNESIATGRKLY
jgi:SAM-dependent methyltransferase